MRKAANRELIEESAAFVVTAKVATAAQACMLRSMRKDDRSGTTEWQG